MTQHKEFFEALLRPFDAGDIKQIRKGGGREMDYITARSVMNRLDEVAGPENWSDTYREFNRGVLCALTIRLPDGTTITKEDVGGYAGMSSDEDDIKSGPSDAFKRAAAKFGVGRHLYRDGIPSFGPDGGQAKPQSNGHHGASAPAAPAPARTAPTTWEGQDPATGRALWRWLSEIRERGGPPNLIDAVNGFIKANGWNRRIVDLEPDQIAAVVEKCHQIIANPPQRSSPPRATARAVPAPAPATDDDPDIPF